MNKPKPPARHAPADLPARVSEREPRDPEDPEDAVLAREIERLQRESEEALAAYERAFHERQPHGRTALPRRFP